MKKIKEQIISCKKCELYKTRTNPVIGKGSLNPKILFVGEAPGAEEDKTGKPFVGRSGKLLDKWINFLGLSKKDYAVVNIVKCRPPENRTPTDEEINACLPFLKQQIELLKPEIIVVLGAVAAKTLTQNDEIISKKVGKFFDTNYGKVFVLFHPSYCLRKGIQIPKELNILKKELSGKKHLKKVFIDNIALNEKRSREEMISPILCSIHNYCKMSNNKFLDINQTDMFFLNNKKSVVKEFQQTNEIDLFEEDLYTEQGKYKDIKMFIFYTKEKGNFNFLGWVDRETVDSLEMGYHFKAQKNVKKIMYDTLKPMYKLFTIYEEKKEIKRDKEQPFCHLHLHTEYSIGDAYGSPKIIAETMWKKGFNYCGITDHGTLAGTIYLQRALKEKNIKPIIGIEAYAVNNYEDRERKHICLFVKNEIGWKNLLFLHNKSVIEGFYYKPRMLINDILEHSDGLIATSACIQGIVSKYIINKQEDKALEMAKKFKEKFKEDFYFEIMPHYEIKEQLYVNNKLKELSEKLNIKMIVTTDAHYPEKEHKEIHNAIKAVSLRKKYGEANFTGNTFYYMQEHELKEIFNKHFPYFNLQELMKNTLEIANKCNFVIPEEKKDTLPSPVKGNPDDYLEKLCWDGLKEKKLNTEKKYIKQLKLEINRIKMKQYSKYFLVVRDYVNWCRENNIMVGPGRGSVGSSLMAYVLGITKIDPIKYNLMYDRFISEIRKDYPDIDLDFEDSKRQQLFKYLKEKYGEFNSVKIATYSTWHGKGALRDVGRIFDLPKNEIEKICSLVIQRSGGDARSDYCLMDTFTEFEQGKKFFNSYKKQSKIAISLESHIRHRGVHAAGAIISEKPLTEIIPLTKINGEYCSEWEKKILEDLGLIKFDILGLKTLSLIKKTIENIKNTRKKEIFLPNDFGDKKVYDTIFKNGKTLGVFQFETVGMSKMCDDLKIDNFKTLYDATTLYRPGPLHSGISADYVLRHLGKKDWNYDHPLLEKITKDTFGLILYQEQVMQIMHDLGNFSWATAESSRKIMTKSKGKAMFEKMRKDFIHNAKEVHNIPEKESSKIFDVVSTFGSYGFNKSHAIEYSIISYWTAWLKTYYPKEFFLALLTLENEDTKIADYVRDAKSFGIKVLNPDINKSKIGYSITDDGIIAGFDSVKQVGKISAKKIIKNQPYNDLIDFLIKYNGSKRIIKNLILAGALNEFNINWKYTIENLEEIKKTKKYAPNIPDYTDTEKNLLQLEVMSLPPEKNPIDLYEDPFKELIKYEKIGSLNFDDYVKVRWIKGIVTFINFKQEGLEGAWTMFDNVLERRYAHLNVNDSTGNILVHLSPEQYTFYKKYMERAKGFPVIVKGHSIKNYQKIYCDAMIVLDDIDYSNPIIKFIKNNKRQKELKEIKEKYKNYKVKIIESVTYKVSKNKKAYARITFTDSKDYKDNVMVFNLTPKIFVAGEIIVFSDFNHPFINVIKRF